MNYIPDGTLLHLKSIPSYSLEIPSSQLSDSYQVFAYVLDCITMLAKHLIPTLENRILRIRNNPDGNFPICYRSMNLIILNSSPYRWAQIAYQYAHELCHYSIQNSVCENLRWFEESICETASLYFLLQISTLWQIKNVPHKTSSGDLYAPYFKKYAEDTSQNFTKFDLKDASEIEFLERECYDRKRNRYVANQLLPIFIANPQLWSAVPVLGQINQHSFFESLDAWILVSPQSAHVGILEIKSLFQ